MSECSECPNLATCKRYYEATNDTFCGIRPPWDEGEKDEMSDKISCEACEQKDACRAQYSAKGTTFCWPFQTGEKKKLELGDTARRAAELLTGEKMKVYGDPKETFRRAARIYQAKHGAERPLSPVTICDTMIAIKEAREAYRHDTENVVDIEAYYDIRQQLLNEGE